MSDDVGLRRRIARAWYGTVSSFGLPASAWWEEYYAPMRARVDGLRPRAADDPAAAKVVRAAEVEIDRLQRFCEHDAYAFYVVQPND
jgi:hypothetical protein